MTAHERFADFRARVQRGDIILGMTCATMSPVVTEIIGWAGFDFAVVDTELLSVNPETVEHMVRAAEAAGTVPIVKLRANDPVMIEDALITGAPIVKVPHIRSAAELKAAVDATYFHPRGKRGLCTVSRANRYGQGKMSELVEWTNREVMLIPIIEDQEAIANLDEILGYEGIEVYEVGPVDLSNSYHLPPDRGWANPEIYAILEQVLAVAKRHGKRIMTTPVFGGLELTPQLVKERLFDKGIRITFWRTDSVVLKHAAAMALQLKKA